MARFWMSIVCGWGVLGITALAGAQPLGTFRWQLRPFCNVVTLAVTANGSVFRLEGVDDQCGSGPGKASAIGTAFQNADGSIGFGFTIVTTPGGVPVHVEAAIAIATLSGTWRDSAGSSGAFVFSPGFVAAGTVRPPPATQVPVAIQLRPDGGLVAGGLPGLSDIPATGFGARMMWYPGKSAFRAGRVNGTGWDDVNIGRSSIALGEDTVASGDRSAAFGAGTNATGSLSTAFGDFTNAGGTRSTAMGSLTDASGGFSTAMGQSTKASGTTSTAMGHGTLASGPNSTAMGDLTTASGLNSTAMGRNTVASGSMSLAAGNLVTAGGTASVALGQLATASTNGTFMFGDLSAFAAPLITVVPNQFLVRAAGGVGFYTNPTLTAGVTLAAGGSSWLVVSDRNLKSDFRDLPGDDVLDKLARMPIQEWSYTAQDAAIRHVGPTAQDFHAAFGLGEDPLRINTIDADGVALRAVQALELRDRVATADQSRHVEALREQVGRQAQVLDTLRLQADEIAALRATVEELKRQLAETAAARR